MRTRRDQIYSFKCGRRLQKMFGKAREEGRIVWQGSRRLNELSYLNIEIGGEKARRKGEGAARRWSFILHKIVEARHPVF